MTEASKSPVVCLACGATGSGRFCSECGAVLLGPACTVCRAPLAPGARFCHRCGTPVGAAAASGAVSPSPHLVATPAGARSSLPWTLVGLAVVALVVLLVAQRAATPDTSQAAGAAGSPAPFAGGRAGAAPDISNMSPRERADRLYDRIMRLAEQGKQDSVEIFASMAIPSFEALGALDADARFDLGRVAELSRNYDVAAAQADTILRGSSTHLLGLILAARVADARGDRTARDAFERRLLAAQATELQKPIEEYTRHRSDIDAALDAARARAR
jgi:hypothetical protein